MKPARPPLAAYRLLQEWEKGRVENRLLQVKQVIDTVTRRQLHLQGHLDEIVLEMAELDRKVRRPPVDPEIPGLQLIRRGYLEGLALDRDELEFERRHLLRTLASRQGLLAKLRLEQARLEVRLRRLRTREHEWMARRERACLAREDRVMSDLRAARQWSRNQEGCT